MIAAPALDLMEGQCVQLRGGLPDDRPVSLPDPVAVARRWWDAGLTHLHVVDLDAALGRGDNHELVAEVVMATPAVTQVGGGVRSTDAARTLLGAGADRVIVGTRAVEDPEWLELLARGFPDRIVLAADVRDGKVLRKGWTESAPLSATALLRRIGEIPLAGVLWTDVAREGRLQGIDPILATEIIDATSYPVWISGGIATMDDLVVLAEAGAAGAVLGMSLYTGAIDVQAVAREFGA